MDDSRGLTITFMDGTKVSFGFPQQGMNAAAKQLKIEEFMKNPFLMVIADGTLMMFPVVNNKAIYTPPPHEALPISWRPPESPAPRRPPAGR